MFAAQLCNKNNMLEQIKNELAESEISAMVQMKNGKTLYGIIVDFFQEISTETEELKFISNQNIENYKRTESFKWVDILKLKEIKTIDMCLK